jgi:hypothetical protein
MDIKASKEENGSKYKWTGVEMQRLGQIRSKEGSGEWGHANVLLPMGFGRACNQKGSGIQAVKNVIKKES